MYIGYLVETEKAARTHWAPSWDRLRKTLRRFCAQSWAVVDATVKALQYYSSRQALRNGRDDIDVRKDPAITGFLRNLRSDVASRFLRCGSSRCALRCFMLLTVIYEPISPAHAHPWLPAAGSAWTSRPTAHHRRTLVKARKGAHSLCRAQSLQPRGASDPSFHESFHEGHTRAVTKCRAKVPRTA